MTLPELVIVPARPGAGDTCPVQFEVRVQADGCAVLPVFPAWLLWCGRWAAISPGCACYCKWRGSPRCGLGWPR